MITKEYKNYKESQKNHTPISRADWWFAMALCVAVIATWTLEQLVRNQPANAGAFAPVWLPLAASMFAAAGIIRLDGSPRWIRVQRALLWSGLLLMVWVANGLLFDLFAMAGLIGDPATGLRIGVNWPGMATRTFALAVAVFLARIALAHPNSPASIRSATWYGYAAFVLALPYPVLRIWWALGGTPGLTSPGAAGHGITPLLLAIPWLLAAALSLFLVSPKRWMPRRLLLIAGWSATALVASIGPAACWSLITKLASGDHTGQGEMSIWVYCLCYGSWFFWAIAAGAATHSYQLRSASSVHVLDNVVGA
jgi:hypothetical protein